MLVSSVWLTDKLFTAQLDDKKLELDDLSGNKVLCGDSDNDRYFDISLIARTSDLYL